MTARSKRWLRRAAFILPIVWLVWAVFFPSRVFVHYDNPEQPIHITLDNYDVKEDQLLQLKSGVAVLYLKRFYTRWDSYFAQLGWGVDGQERPSGGVFFEAGAEEGNDEGNLNLDVCRVDVYLDKNAQLIRTEVKHPKVLYACW